MTKHMSGTYEFFCLSSYRTTASTNMNDTSSRSHAIFTLNFTQVCYVHTGMLYLVILNSMNKTLSDLRCIRSIFRFRNFLIKFLAYKIEPFIEITRNLFEPQVYLRGSLVIALCSVRRSVFNWSVFEYLRDHSVVLSNFLHKVWAP